MALSDFFKNFNNESKNLYAIDALNTFKVSIDFKNQENSMPKWATAFANLLESPDQVSNDKKLMDLSLFVQSVSSPKLTAQIADSLNSLVGNHNLYKLFVQPTETTITMSIINTKYPIIENFFYPWMRELTSPKWVYEKYPYTTAEITVDMTDHVGLTYKYFGARPTALDTYKPSQDLPSKPVRSVTFDFDFMAVIINAGMPKGTPAW